MLPKLRYRYILLPTQNILQLAPTTSWHSQVACTCAHLSVHSNLRNSITVVQPKITERSFFLPRRRRRVLEAETRRRRDVCSCRSACRTSSTRRWRPSTTCSPSTSSPSHSCSSWKTSADAAKTRSVFNCCHVRAHAICLRHALLYCMCA